MQIEDFLELVRKRRSIRKFKPDPVPDEYVENILEAGRWAMSGANGQPWEFVIVKNQDTKREIGKIYEDDLRLTYELEQTRVERLRHPAFRDDYQQDKLGFVTAPVLIVVCGDRRTVQASVLEASFIAESKGLYSSLANAANNMHLAAATLGLGSEWLSVDAYWEGRLKSLLGIPDVFVVILIIPIGYPAYQPASGYRRELKELVHYEKYNMSKYRKHREVIEFIARLREKSRVHYPA